MQGHRVFFQLWLVCFSLFATTEISSVAHRPVTRIQAPRAEDHTLRIEDSPQSTIPVVVGAGRLAGWGVSVGLRYGTSHGRFSLPEGISYGRRWHHHANARTDANSICPNIDNMVLTASQDISHAAEIAQHPAPGGHQRRGLQRLFLLPHGTQHRPTLLRAAIP